MTPYTITLRNEADKKRAHEAVDRAYAKRSNWRVTFEEPKRSHEQNDRMWAMLTDISNQVEYYGRKLSPEDWKDLFTATFQDESRIVPSIDGKSFVQLGLRTSKMSKGQLSDLMELIAAYGSTKDVQFREPRKAA